MYEILTFEKKELDKILEENNIDKLAEKRMRGYSKSYSVRTPLDSRMNASTPSFI